MSFFRTLSALFMQWFVVCNSSISQDKQGSLKASGVLCNPCHLAICRQRMSLSKTEESLLGLWEQECRASELKLCAELYKVKPSRQRERGIRECKATVAFPSSMKVCFSVLCFVVKHNILSFAIKCISLNWGSLISISNNGLSHCGWEELYSKPSMSICHNVHNRIFK